MDIFLFKKCFEWLTLSLEIYVDTAKLSAHFIDVLCIVMKR